MATLSKFNENALERNEQVSSSPKNKRGNRNKETNHPHTKKDKTRYQYPRC